MMNIFLMNFMFFCVFIMFLSGNLIFISMQKHLLVTLLSLEFIVLSIFFFFILYLIFFINETYIIMVFLVFSVCEGALGLSILVSMIRTHGNDYFQSFSVMMN